MSDFSIHILGCGSATPTTRHAPTAQVLDFRNKMFLIDCGEGTQLQVRRYKISFSKITHIFISHLHGDHCFGLPGLISSLGLLGRNGELVVHGPQGLKEFLEPVLAQFCQGIGFDVRINVVDASQHALVMEDRSVSVYSIPLRHRLPTCGYLFVEKPKEPHLIREMIDFYNIPISQLAGIKKGNDFVTETGKIVPYTDLTRPADPPKRYAFCSDTAYSPEIVKYIGDIDCLYHESTFVEADSVRARETFHSTARQAAEIARAASVKQLVLGHYSARYEDINVFLDEAKPIFPNVILAHEGAVVRC